MMWPPQRTTSLRIARAVLVLLTVAPTARGTDPGHEADQHWRFAGHNLVFVSFDALQAAHVGCLGNPRKVTPTIDSLAREGVIFTQARAVASWTVPSTMSWFTGVYPSEHRMTNKYSAYGPKERRLASLRERAPHLATLADVLRGAGYATGGFTGNAGVSGGFGYEQGFDVYFHEKNTFGSLERSVPEALVWLRANRHRRFFLFLHGYDVHGQSTPADGYDYRFVDPGYDRRFTGSVVEQEMLREEGLDRGRLTLRDADVRFWRAIYDEKVNRADACFGRFLEEFERLGLADKTVFVVSSDHGTELYEHRRFDHGFTLYDELLRVPLVVKLPGPARGRVVTDRVSSIDVMPTILDLLGVEAPAAVRRQMRGTSLVPAMRGEPARRDCFAETDYREYTYKRCIVTPDGWKLVCTMENGGRELFDLSADPGEARDLSAAEPARVEELRRRLYGRFREIGADLESRPWKVGLNPVYSSQGRDPTPTP